MLRYITNILVLLLMVFSNILAGESKADYNKAVPVDPTNLVILNYAFDFVQIKWDDNSADEAYFIVERGNAVDSLVPFDTVGANINWYIDYRVEAGAGYYYRVAAFNPSGLSGYTNTVSVNTQPLTNIPPANPDSLKANFDGVNANILSWIDNSYNESKFTIYRSTDGVDFHFLDSAIANSAEYSDYSIQSFTNYYYYVVAENNYGISEATDSVHVYVGEVHLVDPLVLYVARTTHEEVRLKWRGLPVKYGSLSIVKTSPSGDSVSVELSADIFIDNNLEANTTYNYQLELIAMSGRSYRSNRMKVNTLPLYTQNRISDSLVAFIAFTNKSHDSIQDWSWYKEPMGFTLAQPIEEPELPVDFLRISSENSISSESTSKITTACKNSDELSVECWIKTSASIDNNGTPVRIVSFENEASRAFAINCEKDPFNPGKVLYSAQLTTKTTDDQGNPKLEVTEAVDAGILHHIVYTHNSEGSESIYINGVEMANSFRPPSYTNWSDANTFILANGIGSDEPWLGDIYMCAIYSKALSSSEVLTNYYASPFSSDSVQLNPEAFSINLYPNPTSDVAKLSLETELPKIDITTAYYIEVIDQTGMVLQQMNFSEYIDGRIFDWSFGNLDSGIYTMMLKNAYGAIATKKVVVIR